MAQKKAKKTDDLSFEEALERLEVITEKLNEGELSLEKSLEYFEEGIKLKKICEKKIADSRERVNILLEDDSESGFETGEE